MSREDYLNRQRMINARYDMDRAVARVHLLLASSLAARRDGLAESIEEVVKRSGLSTDRIAMIEEGDTTSLTEVPLLCRSLGLTLTGDDHLRVEVATGGGVSTVAADVR